MGFAVEYGFAMWHIASNTSDGWATIVCMDESIAIANLADKYVPCRA